MWDIDLFLLLNFDGGPVVDQIILAISGVKLWIPLYLLILALTWQKSGWKTMLLLIAAIALAAGLSDIITGIFKHSGLLEGALPDSFPYRLRPMHNEELQGMIHVIKKGGQFGTISAHAATSFSIGYLATKHIAKRWFSIIMWCQVALVCYSRIYLGSHYPQDILLGLAVGWLLSYPTWLLFKRLNSKVLKGC